LYSCPYLRFVILLLFDHPDQDKISKLLAC
jgi:hypothetical protein